MHDHIDGHAHSHHHHHESGAEAAQSLERSIALLSYMAEHNKSHAAELHDLAHGLEGAAAEAVHEAVGLFDRGNAKLDEALAVLKGE